jgi:hypothetical protein
MKIKTNINDELEIPESLVTEFKEKCNPQDLESRDEWNDFLSEYLLKNIDGKLVSEEIGSFFIDWYLGNVSFNGGYPRLESLNVDCADRVIVFNSFFWTGDFEEDPKNEIIHTLAYYKK